MNRTAIERFSIDARRKLIQSVESAMIELGVGPKSKSISVESAGDVTVITLEGGLQNTISSDEAKWRNQLIEVIDSVGYENILEQVAYTWFNRLIAIRYMEVNDFLPTHVRVLSSIDSEKDEPDIVTQFAYVPLQIPQSERKEILRLKDENLLDQMFSKIFILQCRELNNILPELFTLTKPYENLLLRLSYVNQDGVLRDLVDNVPEEDFRDAVQIIGWMYQYYNSELKDEVFANLKKNVKISKERIPAATQLFTPDWIVRYMVENSVGRVWLEGHDDSILKEKWKYYLQEAEQEQDVIARLKEIRLSRSSMMPSDITVIDPCMGSGHILVYAFDVLIQIYDSFGYTRSDAVSSILENNIFGLDIDDRAYQLAYFAVMMKARQYNPNIFNKKVKLNLHAIPESDILSDDILEMYGSNLPMNEREYARTELRYLISLFKDAKTYGSLLSPRELNWEILEKAVRDRSSSIYYTPEKDERLSNIVEVAKVLSNKYDAVITNPPYLASSGMDQKLSKFVKDTYPDSKSDLFACFIERCIKFSRQQNYVSMITQHAFMFLSSFESLRNKIRKNTTISSLLHLGAHAFDQIGGEVVQSVTFTLCNDVQKEYLGTYCRLVDGYGEQEKEDLFISKQNRFYVKQDRFDAIPGSPVAYWLSDNMISCFEKGTPLKEIASPRQGLATGENARFVRQWYEVDVNNIKFDCKSRSDSVESGVKWFPYNKGGEYRKWYGNNDCVIDWENDGDRLRNFKDSTGKLRSVLRNPDYYFQPSVTWSKISSGSIAFRFKPYGHIFDVAGTSIFANDGDRRYIHGFCNSNVALSIANAISPTLNYEVGHIASFPIIYSDSNKSVVEDLVGKNIELAKEDWNDYECSWDFLSDPIIRNNVDGTLESAIVRYKEHCIKSFETTKSNEEKINSIFIETYGLTGELSNIVDDDRITIRVPTIDGCIKNLMSYAIGCMFGRYSLDQLGLIYAGGTFEPIDSKFHPDLDNIIPINDNEYFGDDIVTRFVEFIKVAFGEETLEENLKYIANNLGVKGSGTSREKIRKYFLTDFYKDHLKMYSNLPVYWLFDSGKENGFKALIYMHRYNENLIPKMRQDYLLPMQRRYQDQFDSETDPTVRSKLEKKLNEIQTYDIAMELYSTNKVTIDLDDGVKVNYAKFQNIEIPGEKNKINLLYKLK